VRHPTSTFYPRERPTIIQPWDGSRTKPTIYRPMAFTSSRRPTRRHVRRIGGVSEVACGGLAPRGSALRGPWPRRLGEGDRERGSAGVERGARGVAPVRMPLDGSGDPGLFAVG
jgi:hypothetical protein